MSVTEEFVCGICDHTRSVEGALTVPPGEGLPGGVVCKRCANQSLHRELRKTLTADDWLTVLEMVVEDRPDDPKVAWAAYREYARAAAIAN